MDRSPRATYSSTTAAGPDPADDVGVRAATLPLAIPVMHVGGSVEARADLHLIGDQPLGDVFRQAREVAQHPEGQCFAGRALVDGLRELHRVAKDVEVEEWLAVFPLELEIDRRGGTPERQAHHLFCGRRAHIAHERFGSIPTGTG